MALHPVYSPKLGKVTSLNVFVLSEEVCLLQLLTVYCWCPMTGFYLISPSEYKRFSLSARVITEPQCWVDVDRPYEPSEHEYVTYVLYAILLFFTETIKHFKMPNQHAFQLWVIPHSMIFFSLCTPVLPQANGTYKTQSPGESKSAEHVEGDRVIS